MSSHGGFGRPVFLRQSEYETRLRELITRGCEERTNLLFERQRMNLNFYRELGKLRNEFVEKAGWNNYDVVMKLRPNVEFDEDGKKTERPNNNPFIKGRISYLNILQLLLGMVRGLLASERGAK